MSFFDRAKAAATDLAAKADVAMQQAGINTPGGAGGDRTLRDLGVLAYLEATGRPVEPADRERLLAELRELESSGRLGPLTLTPSYAPGTPPPPGGYPPPPGGTPPPPGATPPPPGAAAAGSGVPAAPPSPAAAPSAPPPPPEEPPTAPSGSTPPPPPPSWA